MCLFSVFTNTLPSSARLQFEIFAASTSTCSIRGASDSTRVPWHQCCRDRAS